MSYVFEARSSESPLVESIWRTESTEPIAFMSQAVATWEMVITKQLGKITLSVRGPETKAMPAEGVEDAEFFGIQFKLGTFMPQIDFSSLLDTSIDLPAASGRTVWINSAAWQVPTFENADTFLDRLARQGFLAHDPVVTAALNDEPTYVSPRTLQRRFLNATGLTHGAIHQIARARRAVALLGEGVPILDVVDQAGYADQPHLTRALKHFIGQTPAQIASGSGLPLNL